MCSSCNSKGSGYGGYSLEGKLSKVTSGKLMGSAYKISADDMPNPFSSYRPSMPATGTNSSYGRKAYGMARYG